MNDEDNKFIWDVKNERDQNDSDSQGPEMHPAWETFRENYFPASKEEKPEYFSTLNILEILNSIVPCVDYNESQLLEDLCNAGFRTLKPAPQGLIMWMVKSTPMKMIAQETSPVL